MRRFPLLMEAWDFAIWDGQVDFGAPAFRRFCTQSVTRPIWRRCPTRNIYIYIYIPRRFRVRILAPLIWAQRQKHRGFLRSFGIPEIWAIYAARGKLNVIQNCRHVGNIPPILNYTIAQLRVFKSLKFLNSKFQNRQHQSLNV